MIDARTGKFIDGERAVGALPHAEMGLSGRLHSPA